MNTYYLSKNIVNFETCNFSRLFILNFTNWYYDNYLVFSIYKIIYIQDQRKLHTEELQKTVTKWIYSNSNSFREEQIVTNNG